MPQPEPKALRVTERLGVIGDIHTNVDVLSWALDTLRAQRAELILACGDIPDGPNPGNAVDRCCELLQAAGALTVQGNHDRWLLDGEMRDLPEATFLEEVGPQARSFLRALPASLELDTPLGKLLFGHGLGKDDMAALYPYDHGYAIESNTALQAILAEGRHSLIVSGHTHRRMVRKLGEVWAINAGALSRKREPCCLVLDFAARRARFFDYAEGGKTVDGPSFEL